MLLFRIVENETVLQNSFLFLTWTCSWSLYFQIKDKHFPRDTGWLEKTYNGSFVYHFPSDELIVAAAISHIPA